MQIKLKRIMWFIVGNAVGLAGLLIVMLVVRPADFRQIGADLDGSRATLNVKQQSPLGNDLVGVAVAARDLGTGTILSKGDLKLELMPQGFSNDKTFVDLNRLIGCKTKTQLKAGDVLLRDMLVENR